MNRRLASSASTLSVLCALAIARGLAGCGGATASGAFDTSQVATRAHAIDADVQRCFEQLRVTEPRLHGRLSISFLVTVTGEVTGVTGIGDPSSLARCAYVAERMRFDPAPTDGPVPIRDVVFELAERESSDRLATPPSHP